MYMYMHNINRKDTKFQSHILYSAKFPKTVTFANSYPNTNFSTKQHITMKKVNNKSYFNEIYGPQKLYPLRPLAKTFLIKAHLKESLLEIVLGLVPGCDGVTKKHKLLRDALRVERDHGTHPAKGRVLFLVVPHVAKGGTPDPNELRQIGSHLRWTDVAEPPECNGGVLKEGLGGYGPVDVLHETEENEVEVLLHAHAEFDGDFTDRPRGVVTH